MIPRGANGVVDVDDLRSYLDDKVADPDTEEAEEVIYDDHAHVVEIWQDGEITSTKSGDLYRHRSIHGKIPPLLPEGVELWDTGDSDNRRKVVLDREVIDVIEAFHEINVTVDDVMEEMDEG